MDWAPNPECIPDSSSALSVTLSLSSLGAPSSLSSSSMSASSSFDDGGISPTQRRVIPVSAPEAVSMSGSGSMSGSFEPPVPPPPCEDWFISAGAVARVFQSVSLIIEGGPTRRAFDLVMRTGDMNEDKKSLGFLAGAFVFLLDRNKDGALDRFEAEDVIPMKAVSFSVACATCHAGCPETCLTEALVCAARPQP
jgi:hypothetical protein